MDAEGVQEVLVLGQSYGGQVAQVMVQRFPARVKKLVLSSTGPLAAPTIQRIVLKLILVLAPLLPENAIKTVYQKSLLQILSIPDDRRVFWQVYLDHIFETRLTKADVLSHFRTGADALRKYAFGKSEPWPGAVLVIGGEKDVVSSEQDRSKVLEYYPNARQSIIRGAGHTVAMEKPGQFVESIRGFSMASKAIQATFVTYILIVFGWITCGPLLYAQFVVLMRPHGQKAKELMIGKNQEWRDGTHFRSAVALAWADWLVFAPLFVVATIGVFLGCVWGYVLLGAAGVIQLYINLFLAFFEREYVYLAVGPLAYYTYIWGNFVYWGAVSLVYAVLRLAGVTF